MKIVLIFFIIISYLYSENIPSKKIIVGVRAWKGIDIARKEWTPTINYLNKKIQGYTFELEPLVEYEKIKHKIKNKEIDFLFSDPVLYIESEHNFGVTRLATLQRKYKGLYFDKFGSVIFTSINNRHLKTISDTKNMIFMGVSKSALAGYRMAEREILSENINPKSFFKNIVFSGGRGDIVVKKVLSNKDYIGTVRTGLLENMVKRGIIKKDDFHIINQIHYEYFPFFASTRLYPEFPFSKLTHISDELSKKVLLALLSIKEHSKAAKNGKYARWLIPSEYTEVIGLMKDLNISIYKDLNESITFNKVFSKYKIEFLIFAFGIIILIILLYILKKQKTKLVIQKNEFESIFKYSHDGIAIVDLETNFLNFNNSFLELTGYSKNVLLTKSCRDLTSSEYSEINELAIQNAIKNGFANNFEKECIVNHSKKINVNISISLLPDKNRLLLTVKDISSLKIMESQSKLASMGDMIGNIAHQWRQPLSVITANASTLQIYQDMDSLDQKTLKNSTDSIIKQANYLSKTIENFRNFVKENKSQKKTSLKQIVNESISIIDSSLNINHIKLIIDLKEDYEILVDKNEIIEAVINIINNSKDILKEKIKNEDERIILISMKKVNASTVELSINDSGGGIPKEILHKVLEPYFTTKHQSQGTGLGLSIADKIIRERNNGLIKVSNKDIMYKNKIYKGACFCISFNITN